MKGQQVKKLRQEFSSTFAYPLEQKVLDWFVSKIEERERKAYMKGAKYDQKKWEQLIEFKK